MKKYYTSYTLIQSHYIYEKVANAWNYKGLTLHTCTVQGGLEVFNGATNK